MRVCSADNKYVCFNSVDCDTQQDQLVQYLEVALSGMI